MSSRTFSLADRLIGEIDRAIKVLWGSSPVRSGAPSTPGGELVLETAERLESSRLMRVNHAGEVAAQALYQGQALTARDSAVSAAMRQAAAEEMDHLAWCEQRLEELNGRTSLLNPLWYAGSFAIGAAGGRPRAIAPAWDSSPRRKNKSNRTFAGTWSGCRRPTGASRAILEQMTHDEMRHGAAAASLGGKELPFPLRAAMRLTSRSHDSRFVLAVVRCRSISR